MRYARLGTTDLDVSVVGFGTGSLGGMFGPIDDRQAMSIVAEAIDAGINFFDTSPYYGSAEERLGRAVRGRRDGLVLATKAGRYGVADFDFSPARIRRSLEQSLRLLRTDHVDVLHLHDVEFVPLAPVLEESFAQLVRLKEEGKVRYIGMTGYPLETMRRVITETDVDVILTYAHGTLLDDSLATDLLPLARDRGVGVINAAAVALGLLTPGGTALGTHPATPEIRRAAERMVGAAAARGADIGLLANQYAFQRSGAPVTVVGTAKSRHLRAAIDAVDTPIDEELLAELLALRPAVRHWTTGLPENNLPVAPR